MTESHLLTILTNLSPRLFKYICGLNASLLFTNASDTYMTFGSLIGLEFRMLQSERRTS